MVPASLLSKEQVKAAAFTVHSQCSGSQDGITPLHIASKSGHSAVVDQLIAGKADVGAKDHVRNQACSAAVCQLLSIRAVGTLSLFREGIDKLHERVKNDPPHPLSSWGRGVY